MRLSNKLRRDAMASDLGVAKWELECGFSGPQEASKALMIPLRTYCRYKAEGLPRRLQRETILDRMEAVLAQKQKKRA